PLLRNFRLSAEQFTPADGTTISFEALENRSQQVLVTLLAVELDRDNLPVPGTERVVVTDDGVWNGLSQRLSATPGEDPARLPWEASFRIPWNGDVIGAPLATGTRYALWLKIYDGDENESPDIPDPSLGGLWFSLKRFQLLGPSTK